MTSHEWSLISQDVERNLQDLVAPSQQQQQQQQQQQRVTPLSDYNLWSESLQHDMAGVFVVDSMVIHPNQDSEMGRGEVVRFSSNWSNFSGRHELLRENVMKEDVNQQVAALLGQPGFNRGILRARSAATGAVCLQPLCTAQDVMLATRLLLDSREFSAGAIQFPSVLRGPFKKSRAHRAIYSCTYVLNAPIALRLLRPPTHHPNNPRKPISAETAYFLCPTTHAHIYTTSGPLDVSHAPPGLLSAVSAVLAGLHAAFRHTRLVTSVELLLDAVVPSQSADATKGKRHEAAELRFRLMSLQNASVVTRLSALKRPNVGPVDPATPMYLFVFQFLFEGELARQCRLAGVDRRDVMARDRPRARGQAAQGGRLSRLQMEAEDKEEGGLDDEARGMLASSPALQGMFRRARENATRQARKVVQSFMARPQLEDEHDEEEEDEEDDEEDGGEGQKEHEKEKDVGQAKDADKPQPIDVVAGEQDAEGKVSPPKSKKSPPKRAPTSPPRRSSPSSILSDYLASQEEREAEEREAKRQRDLKARALMAPKPDIASVCWPAVYSPAANTASPVQAARPSAKASAAARTAAANAAAAAAAAAALKSAAPGPGAAVDALNPEERHRQQRLSEMKAAILSYMSKNRAAPREGDGQPTTGALAEMQGGVADETEQRLPSRGGSASSRMRPAPTQTQQPVLAPDDEYPPYSAAVVQPSASQAQASSARRLLRLASFFDRDGRRAASPAGRPRGDGTRSAGSAGSGWSSTDAALSSGLQGRYGGEDALLLERAYRAACRVGVEDLLGGGGADDGADGADGGSVGAIQRALVAARGEARPEAEARGETEGGEGGGESSPHSPPGDDAVGDSHTATANPTLPALSSAQEAKDMLELFLSFMEPKLAARIRRGIAKRDLRDALRAAERDRLRRLHAYQRQQYRTVEVAEAPPEEEGREIDGDGEGEREGEAEAEGAESVEAAIERALQAFADDEHDDDEAGSPTRRRYKLGPAVRMLKRHAQPAEPAHASGKPAGAAATAEPRDSAPRAINLERLSGAIKAFLMRMLGAGSKDGEYVIPRTVDARLTIAGEAVGGSEAQSGARAVSPPQSGRVVQHAAVAPAPAAVYIGHGRGWAGGGAFWGQVMAAAERRDDEAAEEAPVTALETALEAAPSAVPAVVQAAPAAVTEMAAAVQENPAQKAAAAAAVDSERPHSATTAKGDRDRERERERERDRERESQRITFRNLIMCDELSDHEGEDGGGETEEREARRAAEGPSSTDGATDPEVSAPSAEPEPEPASETTPDASDPVPGSPKAPSRPTPPRASGPPSRAKHAPAKDLKSSPKPGPGPKSAMFGNRDLGNKDVVEVITVARFDFGQRPAGLRPSRTVKQPAPGSASDAAAAYARPGRQLSGARLGSSGGSIGGSGGGGGVLSVSAKHRGKASPALLSVAPAAEAAKDGIFDDLDIPPLIPSPPPSRGGQGRSQGESKGMDDAIATGSGNQTEIEAEHGAELEHKGVGATDLPPSPLPLPLPLLALALARELASSALLHALCSVSARLALKRAALDRVRQRAQDAAAATKVVAARLEKVCLARSRRTLLGPEDEGLPDTYIRSPVPTALGRELRANVLTLAQARGAKEAGPVWALAGQAAWGGAAQSQVVVVVRGKDEAAEGGQAPRPSSPIKEGPGQFSEAGAPSRGGLSKGAHRAPSSPSSPSYAAPVKPKSPRAGLARGSPPLRAPSTLKASTSNSTSNRNSSSSQARPKVPVPSGTTLRLRPKDAPKTRRDQQSFNIVQVERERERERERARETKRLTWAAVDAAVADMDCFVLLRGLLEAPVSTRIISTNRTNTDTHSDASQVDVPNCAFSAEVKEPEAVWRVGDDDADMQRAEDAARRRDAEAAARLQAQAEKRALCRHHAAESAEEALRGVEAVMLERKYRLVCDDMRALLDAASVAAADVGRALAERERMEGEDERRALHAPPPSASPKARFLRDVQQSPGFTGRKLKAPPAFSSSGGLPRRGPRKEVREVREARSVVISARDRSEGPEKDVSTVLSTAPVRLMAAARAPAARSASRERDFDLTAPRPSPLAPSLPCEAVKIAPAAANDGSAADGGGGISVDAVVSDAAAITASVSAIGGGGGEGSGDGKGEGSALATLAIPTVHTGAAAQWFAGRAHSSQAARPGPGSGDRIDRVDKVDRPVLGEEGAPEGAGPEGKEEEAKVAEGRNERNERKESGDKEDEAAEATPQALVPQQQRQLSLLKIKVRARGPGRALPAASAEETQSPGPARELLAPPSPDRHRGSTPDRHRPSLERPARAPLPVSDALGRALGREISLAARQGQGQGQGGHGGHGGVQVGVHGGEEGAGERGGQERSLARRTVESILDRAAADRGIRRDELPVLESAGIDGVLELRRGGAGCY